MIPTARAFTPSEKRVCVNNWPYFNMSLNFYTSQDPDAQKLLESFHTFDLFMAQSDFSMQNPGARGRSVNVKKGDLFEVTCSSLTARLNSGLIQFDRKGRGRCNAGVYHLPCEEFNRLFKKV